MKQKFNVTGMTCSACVAHVEKAVNRVDGVQKVAVSLLTNSMTVQFDQNKTSADVIVAAVVAAGYNATVEEKGAAPKTAMMQQNAKQRKQMLVRLVVSLVLCALLMYVAMGHMVGLPLPSFLVGWQNALSFCLVQLLLCLPVWYLNRNYFIVGFKRLFKGSPNMDSLIAVGSAAGAVYGVVAMFLMSHALGKGDQATVQKYLHQLYFESSAMILALVDLGKFLEQHSKVKTGDALAKLKNLAPATAILLVNGIEKQVDSATLTVGDVVAVKNGMAFPADGKVLSGSCFVDESSLSGESLPTEKQTDDSVIGGTVNVGGYVQVLVTSVGQDSVLQKIINLVEEAGSSKAPIQRLADKISAWFVPVVMSISLVAFVVWMCVSKADWALSLNFAISVLVISCPCALGLATPVAIMVATGKGAEQGILIKNGAILERLADIKQVVLDKTGTITQGNPTVKQFSCIDDLNEFFAVVGGIEKQSEHPLGKAVVAKAEQMGVQMVVPSHFQTLVGRGVVATVDGKTYAIGNNLLMEEQGVLQNQYRSVWEQYSAQGLTCLIVAQNGQFWGVIGVGDQLKQSSAQAIAILKQLGVRTVMLTGDNALAAQAIANEVGIEEVFSQVLPHQKEQKIAQLMQSGVTAMVGDGVNDAPALARADVGFAVTNGSDIAVDSADVVLLKNDLTDVATAIALSKKTKRNVKQNLFWAFFYNALGIPLAAGALYFAPIFLQLNPMIAAAAMSLSSIFVVTNALRLRFFRPKWLRKNKSSTCSLTGCNEQNQQHTVVAQQDAKDAQTNANQQNTNLTTMEEKIMFLLKIEGMMCSHCTGRVHNVLSNVQGVLSVEVSLQDATATVQTDGSVAKEVLAEAVTNQGYNVTEVTAL